LAGRCALLFACGMLAGSCEREARNLRPSTDSVAPVHDPGFGVRAGPIATRATSAGPWLGHVPDRYLAYGGNAYAVSEGKRLFAAYNCSGCHANGGGGMGPPLMDPSLCVTCGRPEDIF